MKYFIIQGILNTSKPIDDNVMNEDIAYSQAARDAGLILVSGLKADISGGVSIMKCTSIEAIEAYPAADPLKISGAQEYRVLEFTYHYTHALASEWFKG